MASERIELNTPEGRLMFVNLKQARKIDPKNADEQPKFQLTINFSPKAQATKQFKRLKKAVEDTIANKWGDNPPRKLRRPFLTVDDLDEIPDGIEEGDVFLRLSSTGRPEVVDRDVEPILNLDEVYSGCYGIVNVQCYPWEHQTGGKGVSFGLGPVQKTRDGDPLGGRAKPANKAFEALPEEDDDLDDEEEEESLV
jgi:hypothetical protein